MAFIEDIRINGQLATISVPVIPRLNPVISWDFIDDPASPSQFNFEIRIGTNQFNWGNSLFIGNLIDVVVDSTANSYEYVDHNLIRGDINYGQIRVVDQDNDKTVWKTFSFIINRLPFVTNFSLFPSTPTTLDNIDLNYIYFDADDHEESGTQIRWFKNNIAQPEFDNMCTLPSTSTSGGDSWTAKIIPSDGIEYGPIVETQSVTISTINVGITNVNILPLNANVDDILKVTWDIDVDEYVSLSGTILIEWYLNNILIENSNRIYIRIDTKVGDSIHAVVKLTDDLSVIAQSQSESIIIEDVLWHVYDLSIGGKINDITLIDLSPVIEWKIHKTTAGSGDLPSFLRVVVTKTPSLSGPIHDTGFIQYTKNSYVVPSGVLKRGKKYYVHVVAADSTDVSSDLYESQSVVMSGSSWASNVNNTVGWTIEFKAEVIEDTSAKQESNLGIYIHDGTYFGAMTFGNDTVSFLSNTLVSYTIPASRKKLKGNTFTISGLGSDIKIFLNNNLIINIVGDFSNASSAKFIEYGDIDPKQDNSGRFYFIKYSTDGAFGFDNSLLDANTFYFVNIGTIKDGNIQYVFDNTLSWLPDDLNESTKLIKFNENSSDILLPTVTKNFSPITSIYIDEKRNKYIGTANGVTAIYGSRHEADFELITSDTDVKITPDLFDRISNVPSEKLNNVEPDIRLGWFTIDTTYRAVGTVDTSILLPKPADADEYTPYLNPITSHAVHYYSQRVPGHAWFDKVNNSKGWQVSFSLNIDVLEADDFREQNLEKHGFGIYINDGKNQEIIYIYDDRIRLFYANIFVSIITTIDRDYVISGSNDNISIYQKISSGPVGSYQLILDGSGLFNTPGTVTANSRRPKIVRDSNGIYHAVWHDDGNKRSQLLYSNFNGQSWSNPELVTQNIEFNIRNPSIDVDSLNRVWIVYEDTSWGQTEISISVRDAAGWNPRVRITNARSDKRNPDIKIDSIDDAHVVWEDNRNGSFQIFWVQWQNSSQSWLSSGQFGTDTVVAQQPSFDEDPYLADDPYLEGSMEFKNPKIEFLYPRLWLIYETHILNSNTSTIRVGHRNILDGIWNSSGVISVNAEGNVTKGVPITISNGHRNSIHPSIAVSEQRSVIVITWEDTTDPISQIWGASLSTTGTVISKAEQITSRIINCNDPAAGFVSRLCVILFESNNEIYLIYYDPTTQTFHGSNTGDTDQVVLSNTSALKHPAISPSSSSVTFIALYDFSQERDPAIVSDVEFPDHTLIGDVTADFEISITSQGNSIVSKLDTKEFAFGDISENVGMISHWKDIRMYFGYNTPPLSITKFNDGTVPTWPDNRINDIFVDAFGNIIAASYGGLVYQNVFTGATTIISEFKDKLVTAVKWGGNAIWYVGTTTGAFYTKTAGKSWVEFTDLTGKVINSIDVNSEGEGVFATSTDGIYIDHPSMSRANNINPPGASNIRSVAVDENDIIWGGGDFGLVRIENLFHFIIFTTSNGMRSSHVNDISIVNKHLRYLATAAGVERMNGTKFTNMSVLSHSITNDNIASLQWDSSTNSLWIGSLYKLHEIVFRDDTHDIISDEVVHYNTTDIRTEIAYDRSLYHVLDHDRLQSDPDNPLNLTRESATIFINKNEVDFGYTIGKTGESILFETDLLVNDQVEVEISEKFEQIHDFNQTSLEKTVRGFKRRSITKMDKTSTNQLILLSDSDKHNLLLHIEDAKELPFTTIMLDRELPKGCLEKLDTLTRTTIRFKILASDDLSGLDGYILSNFENFTSDGETPLEFKPMQSVVDHDIGDGLTNTFDSLIFGSTVTIGSTSYTVGNGSSISSWIDVNSQISYLFVATSKPIIIFRFDPTTLVWTAIQAIDIPDHNGSKSREVHEMKTINNIVFMVTGIDGGSGIVYQMTDGLSVDPFVSLSGSGSISGAHARGIAGRLDGTVYFGSSDGNIYSYEDVGGSRQLISKYTGIGQSVFSLSLFENMLFAGTGNTGRLFLVNVDTGDNIIVFDGPETNINEVHIKDTNLVTSPEEANIFIGSSDTTTVYRATLDTLDFTKSYSSFSAPISKIDSVVSSVLVDQSEISGAEGTTVVASVGINLFKHMSPGWEFFYKHDEIINDFITYESNGINGIWIVSNSKITKWTAAITTKTVFLRLRDKAGNFSQAPLTGEDNICPSEGSASDAICCNYAYSINIADLKSFVNEGRIIDVSEYGEILFNYDATPSTRTFYSADRIDEEIGEYISEVFNGSNELVSWKSITWVSTEPTGTSVNVQIRSGITEDDVTEATWTANLIKNSDDIVSIEHITNQYLQFKVILSSITRGTSPTLSSVTMRNITSQASHFFTTNFILPSRPIKGIMTANTFIPVSSDVVFGIDTSDSVDFGDYQLIEPNRLFTTSQGQFGSNFRIGAKLLSPGIPQLNPSNNPGDPYDESSFICIVDFTYDNISATSIDYHFRVRFYNDPFRTQLIHTFYSGNDQTGWEVSGGSNNIFPATGVTISAGSSRNITFTPGSLVEGNQRWYISISAFNGTLFEIVSQNKSFICSGCNIVNELSLVAEYYSSATALTAIPNFSTITPDFVLLDTDINFGETNDAWVTTGGTNLGSNFVSNFAVRWIGKIQSPISGLYSFTLLSNDGSKLIIDHEEVIDHDGIHSLTSKTGTVELSSGFHDIEVHYFESTGLAGIQLNWVIPGEMETLVPSNRLFHATTDPYCQDLTVPRLLNMAVLFEMENGEKVKLNLNN